MILHQIQAIFALPGKPRASGDDPLVAKTIETAKA